eukprot:3012188-Lingulodinium_polyedra.AAC.1
MILSQSNVTSTGFAASPQTCHAYSHATRWAEFLPTLACQCGIAAMCTCNKPVCNAPWQWYFSHSRSG